jgi:hypothetical protein
VITFFLCLNFSFYYDNNNPSVNPVPDNMLHLRSLIQNMKWFSSYLPVPLLFVIELLVTMSYKTNKKTLTLRMLVSGVFSTLMTGLWTLDPTNPEEEPTRHLLARFILIGSLLAVISELTACYLCHCSNPEDRNPSFLCVRLCFLLIRPLQMFNGPQF